MDREASIGEDVVRELLELVSRKGKQLSPIDAEAEKFRMLNEDLDTFLWKICLRETSDPAAAAAAVHLTREALFSEDNFVGPRSRFRAWIRGKPWRRQSSRFWLFDTARKSAAEVIAEPSRMEAVRGELPQLEKIAKLREAQAFKQLAWGHCRLKKSRQTRGIWREGDCTGGCDILFLYREDFKIREIGDAMNLGRTVVHDYVNACEEKKQELEKHGRLDTPKETPSTT